MSGYNTLEIQQLQRIENLLNDKILDKDVKREVVETLANAYPDLKSQ